MSWAKFDDRYDDNRKVRRAWKAHQGSVGLHSMAVTYCARHETDGLVDRDWIEDRVPAVKARRAILDALVTEGLFEAVDDEHFRVHDYLEYNDSHAVLRERRRREAERKAALRANGRAQVVRAESERTSSGHPPDESRCPDTPTRPDPTLTDSLRSSVLSAREAWPTLDANGKRVIEALVAVAEAKRAAKAFTAAQLISVCEKFADRDHVAEAEAFKLWWVDGVGENQPIKDLTATWRNWLKRAPSAEKRAARDGRRPVKPIPADDPLLAAFIETHGRPQS